ncbi:MAG: TonB-dependent receptor [Melioribacteraceae bacterium]|nr:TonB-dependent receptor [Melioribacteraceae bacterium]
MIRTNYKKIKKLIILLFLIPLLMFAQNNGSITGKITDSKGNPLLYANIVLLETTMGAAADNNGSFIVENVPEGNYTLRVTVIGYRESNAKVSVTAGKTTTQNFTLAEDVLQMEGVVISGTAGGAGIKKKDASFAITTISPADIERLAPPSTAAALELVPGVWSESSGGVAGANIMVRGLPSGGDAPFVTMSINGAPVYGTQTLSFFEQSTIFRIDETVGMTEALKGGPSSVFSNGEAGLTTNFNLKKGTDQTLGRVKYTTSDYSQQRVDAVLSGPIADKLYYMVGGYFNTSPGIRNTEFNAENGQQITIQLTKVFKNGVLNGFSRLTDDYGQWVLPMSLGTGNDAGTFSPLGNATRFRTLRINAQGDSTNFDFSKGRGWKGMVSGLNFDYDLGGGWTVRDNLSYTAGDANTYGFVPNGSAMSVSDLTTKLGRPVETVGGKTLTSGYVQSYGHWVVEKQLKSFTNDISLSKKINNHHITVGAYQAYWSSKDFWTLGNQIVIENVTNGDIIKDVSSDSVGGSWNYGLNEAGDATVFAIYAGDSWQLSDKLRLDLGVRYHTYTLNFTLDHGAYPDGIIDRTANLDGKDWAGTAAINYALNKDFGVFIRGSKGSLFPYFDQIRENLYNLESGELIKDASGNVTSVKGTVSPNIFNQFELGIKYEQDIFSLFITGFFNTVDVFDGGVGSAWEAASLKTRTFGAEVDGGLSVGALKVKLLGTFQNGEITESPKAPETVGNSIWRQPDLQLRLAPSYNFQLGNNINASVYGAIRYVGARWNDRGNTYQLDPYSKIDLGVNLSTLSGLTFNLSGDNITDSEGLTEGDPRDPLAKNGRAIFGRSFKFSITVDF